MSVFDESLNLLSDDLALLHANLGKVMHLMTFDLNEDTQQRIHMEINRSALNRVIGDLARVIEE